MARFNQPVKTNTLTKTTNHQGGVAWHSDNPAIELLFTAATTYVGEDTFYEKANDRTQRLVNLVHAATKRNPKDVEVVAQQLRHDFKIRTASILVAAEYAAASGPNVRKIVDSVLARADEPGELLAYWTNKHGRKIPRGIKTGIGDAARRLYTQKNAIKYDTASKGFRFGDVLELCHVHPKFQYETDGEVKTGDKSALFKFVLDDRHHGDATAIDNESTVIEGLGLIAKHDTLSKLPEKDRRAYLREHGYQALDDAGFTWERLSSWLPGGMDAEAWEAIIPSMGVFALVRNLRNFDDARISSKMVDHVISKITDPEGVEQSRMFPYQVLLAYQHAKSDNWKRALNTTVDLASGNLPRLDGSLIVIDTSGSMQQELSSKSKADRVTVAGLQAASIARHSKNCKVVIYGHSNRDITKEVRGKSLLGAAEYIHRQVGSVGHATYGHTAIRDHFDPANHARAIIFTDDQQQDSTDGNDVDTWGYRASVKADIKHVPQVITFNIGGYGTQATMGKGRIHVTGFSDAIFVAVARILQMDLSEPAGTTV